MNEFQAGVQYDDFKGSVAADIADNISIAEFLKKKDIARENERVVGYRVCFSENDGAEKDNPGIVVYLSNSDNFEAKPKIVRAVEVDVTIAKLLSFFKRFDLVMTKKSMNFDDVSVDGPHYG